MRLHDEELDRQMDAMAEGVHEMATMLKQCFAPTMEDTRKSFEELGKALEPFKREWRTHRRLKRLRRHVTRNPRDRQARRFLARRAH